MKNIRQIILVVLAIVFFAMSIQAAPVSSLNNGELKITVKEKDGLVPGALVIITDVKKSRSIKRLTDAEGVANFPNLAAGDYKLRVQFGGFADHHADLKVVEGENKLDVNLVLAQFSETITITTANKREELLRQVAEPTTLLERGDIEDAGGRSAKDVLQEQAGAGVIVNTGGGQGHVSINGVSNNGVLILIDGRRMLGKNSLGSVNLEDLDISRFERVEVVKGAGSAIYGSDALAGVINFISKKPMEFGLNNELDFSYGSYNDVKVSDSFSFRKGDFSGIVSGSYRSFDGYDLDESNPLTIGQPESKTYSLSTNLEYLASEKLILRTFVDYNRRDIDKYFFNGGTSLREEFYNSKREIDHLTFSPEASIMIFDDTMVNFRYTHSRYNREETRVYDNRTEVLDPWQEWNDELSANLNHSWSLGGIDQVFQAGYEFRKERMDRADLIFPDSGTQEAERDINVFWSQNEINILENFKINLGFRYDDYSDFGDEFSPKASAILSLNNEQRVRFSYGHGFRAPRFGELYIDLSPFFVGNQELDPEISDNFTFGYSYTDAMANGSFDFFYNKIKDGITFDFAGLPFGRPITYKNHSEYAAKGFNTSLAMNLPYGFSPSFSYSFVKRVDDDGQEIFDYPKHTGQFKLAWSNPRYGLRANLRGTLNGEVKYDDGTAQPSHQIWSFNTSKKLYTMNNYSIDIFAQVDNLLDETDIFLRDVNGNPVQGEFQIWLPPRTFMFGVRIDMDFSK